MGVYYMYEFLKRKEKKRIKRTLNQIFFIGNMLQNQVIRKMLNGLFLNIHTYNIWIFII